MKRLFSGAAGVALLALNFGVWSARPASGRAASGQNRSSAKYQVKIDNFTFGPVTLAVPAGSTVTWTNKDDVPHTIVSTDGKGIKSPVLDTDEKFSYTFTQAGSYGYYCSIHPRMTGKVIVQ